jgi:hypothetical protein
LLRFVIQAAKRVDVAELVEHLPTICFLRSFLSESPILRAEAQASHRGCMVVVLIGAALLAGAITAYALAGGTVVPITRSVSELSAW